MSEAEMNSYRFSSGTEPTEEMLAQIMREAAADATERQRKATKEYFEKLHADIEVAKAHWVNRINQIKQ